MNTFAKQLANRAYDKTVNIPIQDDTPLILENEHKQEIPDSLLFLKIKGVELDLKKLGINFKPNDQQFEVLNTLIDFFNQKHFDVYTLEGSAGSGKSSIVKILLDYFWKTSKFKTFNLTAPTNRAKTVLEKLSKRETKTLHSLLGLYPDMELDKLDMDNLKFDKKNENGILNYNGNLIVDESSMINDSLYELILQKAAEHNARVLFIGDPAQLKPVKQETTSKVFSIEKKSVLTKVERQSDDNPLHYILDNLRLDVPEIIDWSTVTNIMGYEGDEKGIYVTHSSVEFVNHVKDQFESNDFVENKDYVRLVCFTNKKVTIYNNIVRQSLGYRDSFSVGELLMAHDNHNMSDPYSRIINSCDYVITSSTKMVRNISGTNFIGYELELQCLQTDGTPSIFLLDSTIPMEDRIRLGEELEFLRQEGIAKKGKHWFPYFELKNSFCATFPLYAGSFKVKKKLFDYGYAVTAHKIQGGTMKNIIVDVKDMLSCRDPQQRQQLLYVALSRPTNVAICLAPSTEIED